MSEQSPMVGQPYKHAPTPVTHAERVTFVYFKVWGDTDTDLIEAARDELAKFSSKPYGFKIEADGMMQNQGTVLTYEGRVTAWPETP